MRLILIFFLSAFILSCSDSATTVTEKARPSRFSETFNSNFLSWLNDYYALSELFVKWDSASIGPAAGTMIKEMDNLNFEKKDSAVERRFSNIKKDLNSALFIVTKSDVTLENKRKAFNNFSENLYNYLQDVKYDAAKIYLHECTMPFNDTGRAVWLSKTEGIRNPYLGMYHPRYGSGMLECGTQEATIDFSSTSPNENEERTDKSTTPNASKSKEKKD